MNYIKWAFCEVSYEFWLSVLKVSGYVYRHAKWKPLKDAAFRIDVISFIRFSDAFMALVKLGKRELTKDVVRAYENLEETLNETMPE